MITVISITSKALGEIQLAVDGAIMSISPTKPKAIRTENSLSKHQETRKPGASPFNCRRGKRFVSPCRLDMPHSQKANQELREDTKEERDE